MNKVSINALEKYCKEFDAKAVPVSLVMTDGEKLSFEVKTRLPLEDVLRFEREVVDEVIASDGAIYIPMAKDYMFRRNLLTYYANFTMPKNDSRAYALVMSAQSIIAEIYRVADNLQIADILDDIERMVQFEKEKMVAGNEQQIRQIVNKVSDLSDQMEAAFGDIDGTQMASFIKNVGSFAQDKSVTAQDLADAIVAHSSEN